MLRERVVTPLTVDQQDALRIIEPGEMCRRVADSLGQGEVDKRALNWACLFLEGARVEMQRIIDRTNFVQEAEQGGQQLGLLQEVFHTLSKGKGIGSVRDLQETLESVMEGRKPEGNKVEDVKSVFRELGKLSPRPKPPVTTSKVCLN